MVRVIPWLLPIVQAAFLVDSDCDSEDEDLADLEIIVYQTDHSVGKFAQRAYNQE